MNIFVIRAFISADKDFDGKVDEGEFEGIKISCYMFMLKYKYIKSLNNLLKE